MYNHVLIELNVYPPNSTSHLKIYELDKAGQDEVLSDIIVPYLKGETIEFDGHFISRSNVARIKVFSSENETDYYCKKEGPYCEKYEILYFDNYVSDITKEIVKRAQEIFGSTHSIKPSSELEKEKKEIFIVHGHDAQAQSEVARFIEKLGFKPIILHEQVSSGINSCWREIVRIGNTQKVITTSGTNTYDKTITIRKCSQPNDNLKHIYDILKMNHKPFVRRKSVVHKLELKKDESQQQRLLPLG